MRLVSHMSTGKQKFRFPKSFGTTLGTSALLSIKNSSTKPKPSVDKSHNRQLEYQKSCRLHGVRTVPQGHCRQRGHANLIKWDCDETEEPSLLSPALSL